MGWGRIRVWNDDRIAAKSGFPPHSHRDMEIVTYVRSGAITHKDSLGNQGRTGAGDVQVMSAGSGVTHSEFNLEDEDTTLFQIWIETDKPGAAPGWGAKPFPEGGARRAVPDAGERRCERRSADHPCRCAGARRDVPRRREPDLCRGSRRGTFIWLPAGRCGSMECRGKGDGIAITGEDQLTIEAAGDAELVLVDAL